MARTTTDAVQGIIETQATIPLDPFIEVANDMVTELCEPVTRYSATKLELIERWLSAHFYAVRDPRSASEKADVVGQSFQYKVDLNLAVTVYGQQAMLIDTEGKLASLNRSTTDGSRRAVGITYLGTE